MPKSKKPDSVKDYVINAEQEAAVASKRVYMFLPPKPAEVTMSISCESSLEVIRSDKNHFDSMIDAYIVEAYLYTERDFVIIEIDIDISGVDISSG